MKRVVAAATCVAIAIATNAFSQSPGHPERSVSEVEGPRGVSNFFRGGVPRLSLGMTEGRVKSLPVAFNKDFEFRKTKLYFLEEKAPQTRAKTSKNSDKNQAAVTSKTRTVVQDASINFERQFRLHGAVTELDQRQRVGDYFDFFWRVTRPANVTVRLEYRQEKLRAEVQAREANYVGARGTVKTEFKVIGDDYYDDGRVIAWRCLLIENGAIVAENRSYLWK